MAVNTHGCSKLRGYQSWDSMKRRCDDPKHKDYPRYGGRGVTYPIAWFNVWNFFQDMGEAPVNTTLDRIDNEKGYSKENCRWASPREQNFNRRPYRGSSSGVVGVTAVSVGWRAYGKLQGISYELYRGPSKEQAIAARKLWEDKYVTARK